MMNALHTAPVNETLNDQMQNAMVHICEAYANVSAAIRTFGEAYASYCAVTQQHNDFAETIACCMDNNR